MIVHPSIVPAVRVNPITGIREINPDRYKVQWWSQGTATNARVSMNPLGTTEDQIAVSADQGVEGDCEFVQFCHDVLGPYRLTAYVGGGTNKQLMNVPIHCDLIVGSGMLPLYWPVPLFVEARNAITVKFTSLCAVVTNQVRLTAHGRRYLNYESEDERRALMARAFARREWPFWLGLDVTQAVLTANATGQQYLATVTSDGDLEAEYLVAKTRGPIRIRINQSAGGRPVTGGGGTTLLGVPGNAILGNGLFAYRFLTPLFLKRLTKVELFIDDLSGAANTVELAFVGRLLDYPEGVLPAARQGPSATQVATMSPGQSAGGIALPVNPVLAAGGLFAPPAPGRWLAGV